MSVSPSRSGLAVTWFDTRFGGNSERAVETHILDERQFSLIRLDDEHFTIRAHDQVTPGGLKLKAEDFIDEPCPVVPPVGLVTHWG